MSSCCSLCTRALGADATPICAACHRRAQALGAPRTTAEVAIPALAPELTDAELVALPAAPARCAWCGKDDGAVKKLLGNGAVSICNECVALCADVMLAELGDGWRG